MQLYAVTWQFEDTQLQRPLLQNTSNTWVGRRDRNFEGFELITQVHMS